MTNTIILIITLIIYAFYVLGLWFGYEKDKAKDRQAAQRFGKKILIFGSIVVILNVAVLLINHYNPKEDPATKKDMARIETLLNKLSEPTQKKVESEIDKQFKAEYKKKKKRALELYHKGQVAYHKKDFNIAIRHFEKAIKIFAIPSFHIYRGNTYYFTNKFGQAIADYNKAIELNPNYADAYNNRGGVWSDKGDVDQAIVDYNKAIELNPNLAEAYYNRGNAWSKKDDVDRAIADYTKAIQLNPNLAEAYYNRGLLWSKKDNFSQAIIYYTKAIQLTPNYADAYYNRGNAWAKKDDADRAIADYTKAIQLNPNHAEAYNNRGNAWYKKDDFEQAIKDFKKIVELNPQNANACYNIARLNALLKRPKDACEWLRKAIELKKPFREYARNDRNFDKIRENDCFKKLTN